MQKSLREFVLKKAGKAIHQYHLIESGDNVLVALSGGKDSFALLDVLRLKKKTLPFDFKIIVSHINMMDVPYRIDISFFRDYCRKHDIFFEVIDSSVDFDEGDDRNPCYRCSRKRRKELFEMAKRKGCNKIALGHVMEDVLESLLMNMVFHAEISTMPPKLYLKKEDLTLIRPLIFIEEDHTRCYALDSDFPEPLEKCPYETDNSRSVIKNLLNNLERTNGDAKINLLRSVQNIRKEYLP